MSIRLQQVKALLQGIRDDDALYDSLRERLQRQRMCMIRRASEDLLAVISRQGYTARHVVITGGEPCIHDLMPLTDLLEKNLSLIHI